MNSNPRYLVSDITGDVTSCLNCGAVVYDEYLHDKFHDEVNHKENISVPPDAAIFY
jgi:hypothetical protein